MKVSTVNTSISARKLPFLILLLLFLLLFCACDADGAAEHITVDETLTMPVTEAETEELIPTEGGSLIVSPADALPSVPQSSKFCVAALEVGINRTTFNNKTVMLVYEDGLTFYRQDFFEEAETDPYRIRKCQIVLPDGHTNGKILGGSMTFARNILSLYIESYVEKLQQNVYLICTIYMNPDDADIMNYHALALSDRDKVLKLCQNGAYQSIEFPSDINQNGSPIPTLDGSFVKNDVLIRPVESMPYAPEDALFCGVLHDNSNPILFFFEESMTFYRRDYLPEEERFVYHECTLLIPNDYTDAMIRAVVNKDYDKEYPVAIYVDAIGTRDNARHYFTYHVSGLTETEVHGRALSADIRQMTCKYDYHYEPRDYKSAIENATRYEDLTDFWAEDRIYTETEKALGCMREPIDALPLPPEASQFCFTPFADRERVLFVYAQGMKFYEAERTGDAQTDFRYYRCRLLLPDGYTDGTILGGCDSTGDETYSLCVEAKESDSGKPVYFRYDFTADGQQLLCGEAVPVTPEFARQHLRTEVFDAQQMSASLSFFDQITLDSYVTVRAVDTLPAPPEDSLFCAASMGKKPLYLIYEEGLTFYVQDTDPTSGENSYYECQFILPYSYNDGKIVSGCGSSSGSNQVVSLYVTAVNHGNREESLLQFYLYALPGQAGQLSCGQPSCSRYIGIRNEFVAAVLANPVSYETMMSPEKTPRPNTDVRGYRRDPIDALPGDPSDALILDAWWGLFPVMISMSDSMIFYEIEWQYDSERNMMCDYYNYYECEFTLPEGYTGGKLLGGGPGAGSAEAMFAAEAVNVQTGKTEYFYYTLVMNEGIYGGSPYSVPYEHVKHTKEHPEYFRDILPNMPFSP